MDPVLQGLITATAGFLAASSGFWVYLTKRIKRRDLIRDANSHLLMGLAQDKILTLGMKYIEQGWVTNAEFQNMRRYLYEPYCKLGGNGASERIMHAVQRLPFEQGGNPQEEMFRDIPIRESDATGYKLADHDPYEGEERRGRPE